MRVIGTEQRRSTCTDRLLLEADGEVETSELLVLLLLLFARLVEHDVELVATAHVVEQFDRVGAERVAQLQVLVLEVLLALGQDAQLAAELEGREDRVDARQRYVRLGGETLTAATTRLRTRVGASERTRGN